MRKIILTLMVITVVLLGGCFTETIDQFSTFKFQSVLFFMSTHENKAAPDTSWDLELPLHLNAISLSFLFGVSALVANLRHCYNQGGLRTPNSALERRGKWQSTAWV